MKILVFGGKGTIGTKIVEALHGHEVITVGRSGGDFKADITDLESVKAVFDKVGRFDHLISATGQVNFAPVTEMDPAKWELGLRSKLMGQISLVWLGSQYINDGGSFTLTSGVLSGDYIAQGVQATTINRAIEGFVQAAANEIGRGIRINIISPNLLEESADGYGKFFPGHEVVSGVKVAQAYKKALMGIQTGKIFRVS